MNAKFRPYRRPQSYAQAPTTAIPTAPNPTAANATILLRPLNSLQESSLKKSSANNSTNPAKINNPLEIAFMMPTINSPVFDRGEYSVCVASPMACPTGVVIPYAKAINHGCSAPGAHLRTAMREPRANPSKVSTKPN